VTSLQQQLKRDVSVVQCNVDKITKERDTLARTLDMKVNDLTHTQEHMKRVRTSTDAQLNLYEELVEDLCNAVESQKDVIAHMEVHGNAEHTSHTHALERLVIKSNDATKSIKMSKTKMKLKLSQIQREMKAFMVGKGVKSKPTTTKTAFHKSKQAAILSDVLSDIDQTMEQTKAAAEPVTSASFPLSSSSSFTKFSEHNSFEEHHQYDDSRVDYKDDATESDEATESEEDDDYYVSKKSANVGKGKSKKTSSKRNKKQAKADAKKSKPGKRKQDESTDSSSFASTSASASASASSIDGSSSSSSSNGSSNSTEPSSKPQKKRKLFASLPPPPKMFGVDNTKQPSKDLFMQLMTKSGGMKIPKLKLKMKLKK
jgi:hypothetical protein